MARDDLPDRVSIGWARLIERLCFLYPPVIGVGAVGIVEEADPGVPGLGRALVLFGTFGYTVLTVGLMVTTYADARRLRSGRGWHPSPVLYPVFSFFVPPLAGVVYLARRHRHHGTPGGWSGWWLAVAGSTLVTLLGLAAAVVGFVLAIPGLVVTAVGLGGAVAVGVFPAALHQDAAYVCTRGVGWRPNPGVYLGLAFASLFVPFMLPILGAYYLARRRRTVGFEGPDVPAVSS